MPTRADKDSNWRRKGHRKSRLGCRNCKIRRVKCDESRPQCKKCVSFGFSCNYDPKASDLELRLGGAGSMKASPPSLTMPNDPFKIILHSPPCPYPSSGDGVSTFHLDEQTMGRLYRFQTRTVFSIGTEHVSKLYQKEIPHFAFAHPYVMHIIQTVTCVHDRFLSGTPSKQSAAELYHWSQAASLFNKKLSGPIENTDRDAIWATAALLGVVAFTLFEATTPEEAWPMKPDSDSDLDWLRLCEGKNAIWKFANPLRPDSVFRDVAIDLKHIAPPAAMEFEILPEEFLNLYDINELSTWGSNPYYAAVAKLVPLLGVECCRTNVPQFFAFVAHLDSRFQKLLHWKDPRALLLLALWYGKISQGNWWIGRRSIMECQSICMYLDFYHPDDQKIHQLLEKVKIQCGFG